MSQKLTTKLGPQIRRCLAAFDFDNTVVSQNTGTVIRNLLPRDWVPSETIITENSWMAYMSEIFRRVHQLCYPPKKLLEEIRRIQEVPGFVRLLKRLHECNDKKYDLIIISDSNTVFINEWLKAHGLTECFLNIFTNPAHFDDNGLLHVAPYHHQTECKLSAENLCKGKILDHFVTGRNLSNNIQYERIVYVGDGSNDLCPVLKLRNCDVVCARHGFALEKKLIKRREKMGQNPQMIVWNTGFELLRQLKALEPGLIAETEAEATPSTEH